MGFQEHLPVQTAATAQLAARAEWEVLGVLVDRFQVMAAPEAMQGWVAPEVPVEMGPQVPMV
jgi:hypothetical protein